MRVTATRYHDFSYGHRVVGHENKCQHLHGHNGRVHFTCTVEQLDSVGRVLDFSSIKARLCMWLEDNWDHKFLAWEKDDEIKRLVEYHTPWSIANSELLLKSIVWVPFNPTAENIAQYLLNVIAPEQLTGTGVRCIHVCVEETRKCSASADDGEGETKT